MPISAEAFAAAARDYRLEEACIRAVASVESGGDGFDSQGRPKILFEGHVFWRRLEHYGEDPAVLAIGNEAVLHPTWASRPSDAYRRDQYERLEEARAVDPTEGDAAAFEACSWGKFQIMGYHWEQLGYGFLGEFLQEMHRDEGAHLEAFMRYVKVNRSRGEFLIEHLRRKDWAAFARAYNGPGYRKNRYDEEDGGGVRSLRLMQDSTAVVPAESFVGDPVALGTAALVFAILVALGVFASVWILVRTPSNGGGGNQSTLTKLGAVVFAFTISGFLWMMFAVSFLAIPGATFDAPIDLAKWLLGFATLGAGSVKAGGVIVQREQIKAGHTEPEGARRRGVPPGE